MAKDKKPTPKTSAKKPAKKTAKKTPDIFATDAVLTTWDDPNKPRTSFRHLDAVQMRYICTSLKHLTAEIELIAEVKKAKDAEYESVIDEHLANSLDNLILYCKDFGVLKE